MNMIMKIILFLPSPLLRILTLFSTILSTLIYLLSISLDKKVLSLGLSPLTQSYNLQLLSSIRPRIVIYVDSKDLNTLQEPLRWSELAGEGMKGN